MADKNPKHPLKKKKVTQKVVNIADHDSSMEESTGRKHNKKHYE